MTDPEIRIEQLQPIDFGPNDDDRVKDLYEKVFLLEYENSRKDSRKDSDDANDCADDAASRAAFLYREWLTAMQERKP